MKKHDHKICRREALEQAEALCAGRGARLTPIRRRVLELVWASHKAVKAYDILQQIGKDEGAQAPVTVYRALDFLQEQGLVHKVESLNAYLGCGHPLGGHDCQLFICDACGTISEVCDEEVMARVRANAERNGHLARQMLEAHGTCAGCEGA